MVSCILWDKTQIHTKQEQNRIQNITIIMLKNVKQQLNPTSKWCLSPVYIWAIHFLFLIWFIPQKPGNISLNIKFLLTIFTYTKQGTDLQIQISRLSFTRPKDVRTSCPSFFNWINSPFYSPTDLVGFTSNACLFISAPESIQDSMLLTCW